MARGRRPGRRSTARPALLAMLCAVGLVAAGWAVVSEIRRSPGASVKAVPSSPPVAAAPQVQSSSVAPPVVQTCMRAVDRGDAAVFQARAAVADWTAHVQAMTDQLTGRNTRAETARIWDATRARGAAGLSAFRSAETEYRRARERCLRTPVEEVVPAVAATVGTCRDVTRQTDAVLAAAAGPLADWAGHLKAMADRRAGRLDPARANQLWLATYRGARLNIDRFAAADRVYRGHARCGRPG
jgi:hypothetical protein